MPMTRIRLMPLRITPAYKQSRFYIPEIGILPIVWKEARAIHARKGWVEFNTDSPKGQLVFKKLVERYKLIPDIDYWEV